MALLALAAIWDAKTGLVPDVILAPACVLSLIGLILRGDPVAAAEAVGWSVLALGIVWITNEIWFRLFHRDALGMGDAKWTAVAVLAAGPFPAAVAWMLGSWLALFWIGGAWVLRRRLAVVHFAPFLLIGLFVGIVFFH